MCKKQVKLVLSNKMMMSAGQKNDAGKSEREGWGEGGCTVLNCWSKKARVITGKALMKA